MVSYPEMAGFTPDEFQTFFFNLQPLLAFLLVWGKKKKN